MVENSLPFRKAGRAWIPVGALLVMDEDEVERRGVRSTLLLPELDPLDFTTNKVRRLWKSPRAPNGCENCARYR